MHRKTFFILSLTIALVAGYATVVLDEGLRDRLGSAYYVLSVSIVGCVLLVLTGYVWDRALMQRLRNLRTEAEQKQAIEDSPEKPGEKSGEMDADEVIGLARQIERMAHTLQKTEASYRAIVEDQVDLICRYRADGRLTFVNGAYARFFGRKRQDMIGQPFLLCAIGLLPTANLPENTTIEHRVADLANRWVDYAWTHRAIKDPEGNLLEYQAVGHDITIRKEAEAALRAAKESAESADRAKSEFLAIVGHEIRTPINGVLGFAKLLSETPLDADQRNHLDVITTSGEALEQLISDILDLSKIEAGKLEIEHEPFALRACIEQACQLLHPKALENGLTLEARIATDVPVLVSGDAHRLKQILLNLLGNAIKFTELGGVTLIVDCVRTEKREKDTRRDVRLQFAVRDTGIGIPSEKIPLLFQPFSQVDTSARRRRGGTGLGLIISKRLCERMGGAISVESQSGAGSTFYFTIMTDYQPGETKEPFRDPPPVRRA
jgi:PAS domain S-box-containing protein